MVQPSSEFCEAWCKIYSWGIILESNAIIIHPSYSWHFFSEILGDNHLLYMHSASLFVVQHEIESLGNEKNKKWINKS